MSAYEERVLQILRQRKVLGRLKIKREVPWKEVFDLSNERASLGMRRVDFYIPDIQTIIEVHGQQHYQTVGFGGIDYDTQDARLTKQIKRDAQLRSLCEEQGFRLIELAWDYLDGTSDSELTCLLSQAIWNTGMINS